MIHLLHFKNTEIEALALAGVGGGRRERWSGEESSQMRDLLSLLHTLAWRGREMAEAKGRSMSALAPLAAAFQQLSHVRLFAAPWTVAHQVLCAWVFLVKNTGVGCYFLLQGIFSTQGLNVHLLCCSFIINVPSSSCR